MKLKSVISTVAFFCLSSNSISDVTPDCMKRHTEARCYMELFDFHSSTPIATKAQSDAFLIDLNSVPASELPKNSALFYGSFFALENFSNLLAGNMTTAIGSLSGVNLIQGILSGFTDTRRGFSPNSHISYDDDEINKNNTQFIENYKPAFLKSLQAISSSDPVEVIKENTTIFGVKQYKYGAEVTSELCPGSKPGSPVLCILSSNALSTAMYDYGTKKNEFKGKDRHYRAEYFQFYTKDWKILTPARTNAWIQQIAMLNLKLSENNPGSYFSYFPKSNSQPVGFFYDGKRIMPLAVSR